MEEAVAIVVAAGRGRRFGADKVWVALGQLPVVAYPLLTLESCPPVARTVLVVAQDRLEQARHLVNTLSLRKTEVVAGGPRRRDSVQRGLERVSDESWVLVHDGARPFLDRRLVEQGLAAARDTGAAVAAVPVKDTIKQVRDRTVVRTLPRQELWVAQTPQVFATELLRSALASSEEDVTDEATLVEALGHEVRVYVGSYDNVKITTPEDLDLAEVIWRRREAGGRF